MQFNSIVISSIIVLFYIFIGSNLYAGYYEDGCKSFTYKKYDQARELFQKDIEISDNGNSYYFLGEIEKNEGNFEKAEEYYKLSISKNITKKYKKLAYWNLIILQEQQGRYGDMVVQCREFWEDMDEDGAKKKVETVINKFLWTNNDEAKDAYNTGIEYKKKGIWDKAKENFYYALRIDPNFFASKFELALVYLENDNANYAIQYLREISDEIPFYGEVHLLLGDIYFNSQSYDYSIYHLTKAIEYGFLDKKTKYLIQLKLGTSYYEISKYDKALEEITAAVEFDKKAVEPLLILSAIYIKTEDYKNALATLLKARDINKNNAEIIYQIGSLYYKTENQQYITYFNLLFNKLSNVKDTIPQKYYKAFILLLKKQYENNKFQDAFKIIEYIPENLKTYEIHLIAARTFFHVGKYEKAIEYFEKISLENDDKYLLSISYAKNDMTEKAKDILWNLSEISGYLEKAKSENAIKKIAYAIEDEKKRIEEEKNTELEKQIEEKKIEAEINKENITSEKKTQPEENSVENPGNPSHQIKIDTGKEVLSDQKKEETDSNTLDIE